MWDRWQRGESLSSIGRAFGKESSSIHFQISPYGGIRPAPHTHSVVNSATPISPTHGCHAGTPAGVGSTRRRYLQPSDLIESTIEGIGSLRNRCVSP